MKIIITLALLFPFSSFAQDFDLARLMYLSKSKISNVEAECTSKKFYLQEGATNGYVAWKKQVQVHYDFKVQFLLFNKEKESIIYVSTDRTAYDQAKITHQSRGYEEVRETSVDGGFTTIYKNSADSMAHMELEMKKDKNGYVIYIIRVLTAPY